MRAVYIMFVVLTVGIGCLGATLTHLFNQVTDPYILVEASKHRVSSTSGYWEDALVQFALQGTGIATGGITVSTDDYTQPWARPENSTNNPNLYGGFTFTGQNFSSLFLAQTYCWWGYKGGTYLNAHSLEVDNPTSFLVEGDVFAITADSAPQNAAGQRFQGVASRVLIEAARQVIYHKEGTWTGALFSAEVTAASTVDVSGYTEGRYFQTTHHFPLAVPEMGKGNHNPPYAEGFGFLVSTENGGNIVGFFTSTYAYQSSVVFTNMIAGEAGIWMTSWGEPWQAWLGYPGSYPVYGDPVP